MPARSLRPDLGDDAGRRLNHCPTFSDSKMRLRESFPSSTPTIHLGRGSRRLFVLFFVPHSDAARLCRSKLCTIRFLPGGLSAPPVRGEKVIFPPTMHRSRHKRRFTCGEQSAPQITYNTLPGHRYRQSPAELARTEREDRSVAAFSDQ